MIFNGQFSIAEGGLPEGSNTEILIFSFKAGTKEPINPFLVCFSPLNLDTRAPKKLGGSNSHLFFEALQFVIEERFFVLQTSQQTPSMLLF